MEEDKNILQTPPEEEEETALEPASVDSKSPLYYATIKPEATGDTIYAPIDGFLKYLKKNNIDILDVSIEEIVAQYINYFESNPEGKSQLKVLDDMTILTDAAREKLKAAFERGAKIRDDAKQLAEEREDEIMRIFTLTNQSCYWFITKECGLNLFSAPFGDVLTCCMRYIRKYPFGEIRLNRTEERKFSEEDNAFISDLFLKVNNHINDDYSEPQAGGGDDNQYEDDDGYIKEASDSHINYKPIKPEHLPKHDVIKDYFTIFESRDRELRPGKYDSSKFFYKDCRNMFTRGMDRTLIKTERLFPDLNNAEFEQLFKNVLGAKEVVETDGDGSGGGLITEFFDPDKYKQHEINAYVLSSLRTSETGTLDYHELLAENVDLAYSGPLFFSFIKIASAGVGLLGKSFNDHLVLTYLPVLDTADFEKEFTKPEEKKKTDGTDTI
ncbi:MAG: hypothetical protein LBN25_04110 [Christensenellaceae bacterium]|jgi:hypothetical protein|nr:hypothetical protein [Christensenellaceae bacterium]